MIEPDKIQAVVDIPEPVRVHRVFHEVFVAGGPVLHAHSQAMKDRFRERFDNLPGVAVILPPELADFDRLLQAAQKLKALRGQT